MMLAKIEYHEIDSWNLVRGTSEMYATIIPRDWWDQFWIMRLYVTLGWLEYTF
jgi:hypothetical protein